MSYDDYGPILSSIENLARAPGMPADRLAQYAGLIPDGLQEIWRRHGPVHLIGDGRMQFCDPAPIQRALAPWFDGDPELEIGALIPVAYASTNFILLTDGTGTLYDIDLSFSTLSVPVVHPGETLDDAVVRHIQFGMSFEPQFEGDVDIHAVAAEAHGAVALGEVFGWVPPFQVSMEGPNRLEKFTIEEQITRLQAIGPLSLHRTFKDVMEAAEFGGETFVRNIGAGL